MWCEAVRTATAWLLVFIFFAFFDVPLCSDVKSWPRKSLSSVSASASKRLFPISGPLDPSLYLYRFLEILGPKHIAIS